MIDTCSISSELLELPPYAILQYSGITIDKSYDDLIQAGRDDGFPHFSTNNASALDDISHLLNHDSKVTMYYKGVFQKGYINYSP